MSDELGKAYSSDNQVFDFKVESEIVGNVSISYEVTVAKTASSRLDEEYIKIYLRNLDKLSFIMLKILNFSNLNKLFLCVNVVFELLYK